MLVTFRVDSAIFFVPSEAWLPQDEIKYVALLRQLQPLRTTSFRILGVVLESSTYAFPSLRFVEDSEGSTFVEFLLEFPHQGKDIFR